MNSGKILLRVFLVLLLVGIAEVVILFVIPPFSKTGNLSKTSKTVRNVKTLSGTSESTNNGQVITTYYNYIDSYQSVDEQLTGLPPQLPASPPHLYWNMTVIERQKFQQHQVEMFCHRHGYDSDSKDMDILSRHMLLHVKAKTAFCFAPKVGCTNLKILFYLSQGALPSSLLFKKNEDIKNGILEETIKKHSFTGLSSATRRKILKTYYKFIMYRNPVERLVSAYRSKVEKFPLQGFLPTKPEYNWLKRRIFKSKHPKAHKIWTAHKGKAKVPISFPDFVDYWLTGYLDGDEHFQTIYNLCRPCHVRYDYYGNFDTFDHDAEVLIRQIKSDPVFLRDSYYKKGEQTSTMAPSYYQQISLRKKKHIVIKLTRDLSFYYAIFPSQHNSHKSVMNITFDIPPFH